MATSSVASLRKDFADTVGWHDLVAQVAAIYKGLPADQRAHAVLLTDNYGEAGAINTYGPAAGLPEAYTGQLSYYYWRPPSLDGPVIGVGIDSAFLATLFANCTQVGSITNSYGLHNEEFGKPLTVCDTPRYPLDELWPKLRAFR
jgi:hypothetical protein